jgi:NAD(P)-dependent dehydrogenase (short-subunit alcohol dehydrogenase family)
MTFKTILVAGASRGIGLAVAKHLASQSDRLLSVSRSAAPIGEWIQADLSNLAGIETVAAAIGSDRLDALLYMGGTWETHAFTSQYRFEACSDADIANVIAVNLVAPIRLVKALLPALRRSKPSPQPDSSEIARTEPPSPVPPHRCEARPPTHP